MLLAANYAPRKNLENAHIRQIHAKNGSNFAQKGLIWQIRDYLLWRTILWLGLRYYGLALTYHRIEQFTEYALIDAV